MRTASWLMVVVALLFAAVASVAVMRFLERPWVQVVGDSALRTNAPSKLVADAEQAVIERYQNLIANEDGTKSDPTFSSSARSWKSGRSPDRVDVEVVRGSTEVTDAAGYRLRIERISSSNSPTLVFIEYDGPAGAKPIVSELLGELESRGIAVR